MKKAQRVVLVTGASGGIGSEIARTFLSKGWNGIFHYCSSNKNLESLKKLSLKYGVKAIFLKADFAKKRELSGFIDKIKHLRVDSLINNAGSYVASKYFSDLNISDIEKTFFINAFAPILISSAVFKQMETRHFGRIVNISSIAAKYGGSVYSLHYGCSKLALEGITKTLSREGAKCGILINTIRPGVINTGFHEKFPKDMKKRKAIIPLKRLGEPKDVAKLVYFLASEENEYITNEDIAVSGGE